MKRIYQTIFYGLLLLLASCTSDDITIIEEDLEEIVEEIIDDDDEVIITNSTNILALGDSYTIGQSVCETCRFPEQLKSNLIETFNDGTTFNLKVIAQTGWTTNNLINAISNENPENNNDLVTLLIGVNNQYQNKAFSVYETEFPLLVSEAIELAQNDKSNVIVISIPDYAYTPFGQNYGNTQNTSSEIDQYNAFAENYCNEQNITFVNITDITRQGLNNPSLVASDGLHPSQLTYSMFVQRLLPIAIEKIQ
ncbi:SGNH/GDSL hydrolase family protein [Winogradskyella sp. Asnod2-B02-A]|uniref:SGNH/GDSL hydrolase family protein n=1 Tax=Winogradskyella sp. Asnod2-B02-A TaxID=3160583 RepID=UPI00386AEDCC